MAEPMRPDAHASHDLELAAAAAVDDLAGDDRDRAARLIGSCPACSSLAADLRAIAGTTRSLGSAFEGGVAPAPRDFRLSADDAKRLGRTSWLSWKGATVSRPWVGRLGGVLATFGLVGLLLSTAPMAFLDTVGGAVTSEQGSKDLGAGTGPGTGAGPNAATASDAGADYGPPLAPVASGSSANATAAPDGAVATPTPVVREDAPILPDRNLALRTIAILALIGGLALMVATRAGRRAGP